MREIFKKKYFFYKIALYSEATEVFRVATGVATASQRGANTPFATEGVGGEAFYCFFFFIISTPEVESLKFSEKNIEIHIHAYTHDIKYCNPIS